GDVVALPLEPEDGVVVGAEEAVQFAVAFRLGPVEGDVLRARVAGVGAGAAAGVEVERLAAPQVVGLVVGGGQCVEDVGGARVVAHGEHDHVLDGRIGDVGQDRLVDAGDRQRFAGDRVGDVPVRAAEFAGRRVRLVAFERVVDFHVRRARGRDQACAVAAVVADPVDADVDGGRREGAEVGADLQRDVFAEV